MEGQNKMANDYDSVAGKVREGLELEDIGFHLEDMDY